MHTNLTFGATEEAPTKRTRITRYRIVDCVPAKVTLTILTLLSVQ